MGFGFPTVFSIGGIFSKTARKTARKLDLIVDFNTQSNVIILLS